MTNITLNVASRAETGKRVHHLRQTGQLPAVVYGHGVEPKNILVDYQLFAKAYQTGGESTLVDLRIDQAEPVKVLIQDVQRDPTTEQFLHVDFHQVRMNEKIRAEVELKFIGEAPAIKELSGVLVTTLDTLSIECLPNDLVHEIEVDLSKLKTFKDSIHVADLAMPKGITVMVPADEVIALVQEPRSEKEFEAAPAPESVVAAPVAEAAAEAPTGPAAKAPAAK